MANKNLPFEKALSRSNRFHSAYEALYVKQTQRTPTLEKHLNCLNLFCDQSHNGTFGTKKNVLLVSSPPGHGNSTLLTAFVEQRRLRNSTNDQEYVLGK